MFWAPFTVDVDRGLVYLPVSTPSNDFTAAAARAPISSPNPLSAWTQTRKTQMASPAVHHGLWDYDLPSPPNLVTITVMARNWTLWSS